MGDSITHIPHTSKLQLIAWTKHMCTVHACVNLEVSCTYVYQLVLRTIEYDLVTHRDK